MIRRAVPARSRWLAAVGVLALLGAPILVGSATATGPTLPTITPRPFASASSSATPPQSKPDDIAHLNGNLYVTYQNGVGPDGSPSPTGVFQSTVVEYAPNGNVAQSWLLLGRCDGLGADPANNRLLASVNEDNNSSLYSITPGVADPLHLSYSPNPSQIAPGESSPNGGTDSIAVGPTGKVFIAHSNPDPGFPSTAATYTAQLKGTDALLEPLFNVDSRAKDVVTGKETKLALTDPDSNSLIPASAPTLGGTLLQDSQGDGIVVIVKNPSTKHPSLASLTLHNAETPSLQPTIDDISEVTGPGTLYVVDQGAGTVQTIDTAGFTPGTLVVAQPSDSTTNPPTTGQLGVLDPATGVITHFANAFSSPKGLVFVAH